MDFKNTVIGMTGNLGSQMIQQMAGFDPVFGARPLKRAIQERIENPLSRRILDGTLGPKDRVKVGVGKGQLTFGKA